jgi:hypothetical protein
MEAQGETIMDADDPKYSLELIRRLADMLEEAQMSYNFSMGEELIEEAQAYLTPRGTES